MKLGLLVLLYNENTMYKITDDKLIKCTVPLKSKLPSSRETRIASRESVERQDSHLERRDSRLESLEKREYRLVRALKKLEVSRDILVV